MGIIKTAMGLRGERRVSGVGLAFQRLSMFDHYRASSYATAYPIFEWLPQIHECDRLLLTATGK